jgi:1-acyl-sn-glycerol-3-phosphate acyltransferase
MRWWYRLWQYASQVVFSACLGFRTYGRENIPKTGPVLLLSNHQSFLDPILCGAGLPRELDYIARDSLFRNRWFARYIRSLNAFPIQRDQADLAAVRSIIKRLRTGRAIVLFPEATRTPDGRIRPIKGGFDLIMRKANAPAVPVVIDGAYEVWPRTQRFPCLGRITVTFGEPITPEQTRILRREELVELFNNRFREMQNRIRQRSGKKAYNYTS